MSFAYWFFTFVVLGSFPSVFALIQIYGFSKLPNVRVNWIVATVFWSIVGVIACILAWFCVWGGFGALVAWIFELFMMGIVCLLAFKDFESSAFAKILKAILGL